MNLPKNPRELFEEGGELLQDTRIVATSVEQRHLNLYLTGPQGQFTVQISAQMTTSEKGRRTVGLAFDYDEPLGAGNDPFGRPSPHTNPSFWCE